MYNLLRTIDKALEACLSITFIICGLTVILIFTEAVNMDYLTAVLPYIKVFVARTIVTLILLLTISH